MRKTLQYNKTLKPLGAVKKKIYKPLLTNKKVA